MDLGHGGNVLKPDLDLINLLSNIGALAAALAGIAAGVAGGAGSADARPKPSVDEIRSAASALEPTKKPARITSRLMKISPDGVTAFGPMRGAHHRRSTPG